MQFAYDKKSVGTRIKKQRKILGFTQENMAEWIDKSIKHYADIERGQTGMAIEGLLDICNHLNLTPNYVLLGDIADESLDTIPNLENVLAKCTPQQRIQLCKLINLFLGK